jgi:hypothetical protein
MIIGLVKDHFNMYLPAHWLVLSILLNEFSNNVPVAIEVVHVTITSWCGSKARQATAQSASTGRTIDSSNVLTKTLYGTARNSFRPGSKRVRSGPIEHVLTKGHFQITYVRCPVKTLDFDRDFLLISFGSNEAFCSQVHKDVSLSEHEDIRIVSASPAVLDKRVLDDVVINVWSRYIKEPL